jgi:hypothetical protein
MIFATPAPALYKELSPAKLSPSEERSHLTPAGARGEQAEVAGPGTASLRLRWS